MQYVSIFDELSHVSEKPMTEKSQLILLIYDIKDDKQSNYCKNLIFFGYMDCSPSPEKWHDNDFLWNV